MGPIYNKVYYSKKYYIVRLLNKKILNWFVNDNDTIYSYKYHQDQLKNDPNSIAMCNTFREKVSK